MSNMHENTPATIGHGVRRLCIAVDLERYSQRPDSGQVEAQRAMSTLMREASDHGALERAQWIIQPQGDGELALLPPGIDEAYVITSLVRHVSSGLHRYNQNASEAARLRMRIAAHEGVTYVGASGFAGDAINTVCRLRDAQESKEALRTTRNHLVLIASERIYQDVICGNDAYDLPPADFQKARIVMADKNFRAQAYIYSGSNQGEQPSGEPKAGPAAQQPSGGAIFNFGERTTIDNVAGRDQYIGDSHRRDYSSPIYRVRDE